MSDIWSLDGSAENEVGASDGWAVESESDADAKQQHARASCKRRRVVAGNKRPSNRVRHECDVKQQDSPVHSSGEEDDLLSRYLAAQQQQQQQQQQQHRDGQPQQQQRPQSQAASAAAPGAPASHDPGGGVLSHQHSEARAAVLKQRALQEALAQANAAAGAPDDGGVEVLSDSDSERPATDEGGDGGGEQTLQQLLDEPASPAPAPAAEAAAAAAAAAAAHAGRGTRIELSFNAQGREPVALRVAAEQPLRAALERFRGYAAQQGWPRVSRFVFDGARLHEQDSAADIGLEQGDCIDVYLEGSS